MTSSSSSEKELFMKSVIYKQSTSRFGSFLFKQKPRADSVRKCPRSGSNPELPVTKLSSTR